MCGKTKLFTLLIILLISNAAVAARLSIGEQSGEDFEYNKSINYVSISLKDLNLPSTEDKSSKLAKFFKNLFVDRNRFGIAYIEVTPTFGKKEKTILFTYERDDNERYKYKYIGASEGITYQISRPFIFSDPVSIDIVIKEWEDKDASSAVKTIIGAAESSSSVVGSNNILSNITLLLDLVENLFPAESKEDVLNLKLNPNDINNEDIQINGDVSNFFKLSLRTTDAYFEDYDTNKGIKRAEIKNTQTWKKLISKADKSLSSDGKKPLIELVKSYADYISTLPLNEKDQAILTACSITDWANNAVKAKTTFKNKKIHFTAHDYSDLPIANLTTVRESRCNFTGINCETGNCTAMHEFIKKSSTTNKRKIASERYLDGELNITFTNSELTLTPEDYISSFKIVRQAFFDTHPTGPNSWSYFFEENSLDLRIKGKRYEPYKIRIDLVKDTETEADKYYISGIEIYTDIIVADSQ